MLQSAFREHLARLTAISTQESLSEEDKEYLASKPFSEKSFYGFSGTALQSVLSMNNFDPKQRLDIFKLACADKKWFDNQYIISNSSSEYATLMHFACMHIRTDIIRILNSSGYSLNELAKTSDGNLSSALDIYTVHGGNPASLKQMGAKNTEKLIKENKYSILYFNAGCYTTLFASALCVPYFSMVDLAIVMKNREHYNNPLFFHSHTFVAKMSNDNLRMGITRTSASLFGFSTIFYLMSYACYKHSEIADYITP